MFYVYFYLFHLFRQSFFFKTMARVRVRVIGGVLGVLVWFSFPFRCLFSPPFLKKYCVEYSVFFDFSNCLLAMALTIFLASGRFLFFLFFLPIFLFLFLSRPWDGDDDLRHLPNLAIFLLIFFSRQKANKGRRVQFG